MTRSRVATDSRQSLSGTLLGALDGVALHAFRRAPAAPATCAGPRSWRAASFCELVGAADAAGRFAPLCNAGRRGLGTFVHYATTGVQKNAGDSVLPRATRMAVEYFFGAAPTWALREVRVPTSARDVEDADAAASAVLVGGGGLFYPANAHARQNVSGWQWPVHRAHLLGFQAPVVLFAVGWNAFRGQAEPPAAQWAAYLASLAALAARARGRGYVTLRESYSLSAVAAQAPDLPLHYQSCATTLLATLQPCLASESLLRAPRTGAGGRGVLAVNLADDQLDLRLGPPADQEAVLAALEAWLAGAHAAGWTVHVVLQATSDRRLLRRLNRTRAFPFETITFNATTRKGGGDGPQPSQRDWLEVVDYYRGVTVAASSRGHGVMIPFGLHVATISLVTHEKVRAFARDVGHPEWAVELAPARRPRGGPGLAEELTGVLDAINANRSAVHAALVDAQRRLAAVAAANALRWAPAVVRRQRDLSLRASLAQRAARTTLRALAGRHAGADVYVLGSGPTLGFVDPAFFRGRVTVGVNQVNRHVRELTYLVRKDLRPHAFRDILAAAGNRTTHVVTRGYKGGQDWANARTVLTHFGAELDAGRIVVADHACHTQLCNGSQLEGLPPPGDRLVVTDSTITTAIHLAAHLGAARIIVCGHDLALLDGEANFGGYHDSATLAQSWALPRMSRHGRVTGRAAYAAWLSGDIGAINISRDTLVLRDLLQARYPGLLIYSLSPFLGLGLEGHRVGAPIGRPDAYAVYDRLDRAHAYHEPNRSLEAALAPHLRRHYGARTGVQLVSLGCSLGHGVEAFADAGFDAYGVDVSGASIEQALQLGRGRRCTTHGGAPPCLQRASLTALPFADAFFEAGVSADVLEHLRPADIPRAVAEVSRVVRSLLFLRISTVPEGRKMSLDGAELTLHLTVRPRDWWLKQFEACGWREFSPAGFPRTTAKAAFVALLRANGTTGPAGLDLDTRRAATVPGH